MLCTHSSKTLAPRHGFRSVGAQYLDARAPLTQNPLRSGAARTTISLRMELADIREGLQPFLAAPLAASQLRHISRYVDMLLRWNARVNLTSVRQPKQILARHFGESIFTGQYLFPANDRRPKARPEPSEGACPEPYGEGTDDHLLDIGSGAGFPGLPIKICYPELQVTLIESNQKKATFLREVVRSLALTNVDVFCSRAEGYAGDRAGVVTLRAVERFDEVLPVAASLVTSAGRLALLVGAAQGDRVPRLAPNFAWDERVPIPLSANRILLVGRKTGESV